MARRFGIVLATAVMASLASADGLWACGCMNRLLNGCGGWRVRECSPCCEPVVCCESGRPSEKSPAGGGASVSSTVAPQAPAETSPAAPTPAPKPENAAPALKAPVLAPPKEVETPAEPRVAKPVTSPSNTAPTLPEQPPLALPKAPTIENPLVPTPPKTDDTKPSIPDKKPAKDDPFGASNDVKQLRQWTDASGKYRIEARFVSFQDGAVHLQKANGGFVRIDFDLLSAVDRNYVLHQDGTLYAME